MRGEFRPRCAVAPRRSDPQGIDNTFCLVTGDPLKYSQNPFNYRHSARIIGYSGGQPYRYRGPDFPTLGPTLGERFEYLAAVKLAGHSKDAITLSVLTTYQADNIRRHCQADILAVAGASELKFEVILPEPLRKRR